MVPILEQWMNTVIEGNCLALLPLLPDKCINMILCDLPYQVTQNSWDVVIDLVELWKQYERIIADNGAIVLSSQGRFTGRIIMSNPAWFKYKIVWIKSRATNFLNKAIQPLRKHEDLCVFYKKKPVYHHQLRPAKAYDKGFRKNAPKGNYGAVAGAPIKSDGPRLPFDVIFHEEDIADDFVYVKTCEHESKVYYHPVQKSIELGRYLIRTYSNPGDLILDNACGSGSFLVAAKMEGRNFIGMEKNDGVMLKGRPVDLIATCKHRLEGIQINFGF